MISKSFVWALVFAALSIFVIYKVKVFLSVPPIPKYVEQWWGPGEPQDVDESVRPFKIAVSREILLDLNQRLEKTLPFQKPLEGVKQHYGMNTNLLKTIIDYWKYNYNWTEREIFYNQYPHFITNIQGLDMHFVHVKPKDTKGLKVLPLMVLHGWLGSVREFYDLVPYLITPQKDRNFVFEVIIPSLPGYAYSDGASKPGLGPFHMAAVMKNLMIRLGFKKIYLHGTDWGAYVVQHMAVLFPENVIALHSNFCIVNTPLAHLKMFFYSLYPHLFVEKEYIDLMYPLSKLWSFRVLETGYFHIQATKPDTVGVGIRDSPAGLAAYMLEKFTTLTDPAFKDLDDGGLLKKYSMETLIDNVMLYWVTRSITTSMRIYSEHYSNQNRANFSVEQVPVSVPTGCARFKYDVIFYTKDILIEKFPNLVHLTYYEGGHFPALESPEVLAEDIFMFVKKVLSLT